MADIGHIDKIYRGLVKKYIKGWESGFFELLAHIHMVEDINAIAIKVFKKIAGMHILNTALKMIKEPVVQYTFDEFLQDCLQGKEHYRNFMPHHKSEGANTANA